MSALTALAAFSGRWQGVNRLHDPNTGRPEDSDSILTVEPMLSGRFVRIDYTWAYQRKPQEGSLLLGGDPQAGDVTGHWIDTWHMGHAALHCRGKAAGERVIDIQGSYPAPPGADWGWRIEVAFPQADSIRIAMFNIDPEGRSEPATEATYERAGGLAEIGQIALVVGDVNRSLPFYRDVLGLKFLFSAPPNLAFLAAGDVRIMLSPPEGAGKIGENSVLYFKVKNVADVHAKLVERGAKDERAPHLIAKMPDHELWIGFVRDPDGNVIGLMEEKRGNP